MSTENLFMATLYLTRSIARSAQAVTSATFDFGALPAGVRHRILSIILDDSTIQLAAYDKQAFIPLNVQLVSKTFSTDLAQTLQTWTPPKDMTWRILSGDRINDVHDHAQSLIHRLLSPYRSTTALTPVPRPPPHRVELALFHPAAFAQLSATAELFDAQDRAAHRWPSRRHTRPSFSHNRLDFTREGVGLMRHWQVYMAGSKVALHVPDIQLTLDLTLPRRARHLGCIGPGFWDQSLHTVLHSHDAGSQGTRCERCAGVTLVGTLRQEDWDAIEATLADRGRGFVRIAGGGLRLTGEDVVPPRRPRKVNLEGWDVDVSTVDTWAMYTIIVVIALVALLLGLGLIGW